MAHLRLVGEDEATGLLCEEYAAALARAGKVFNIVKAMSLSPGTLAPRCSSTARSCSAAQPLSRAERELLADARLDGQRLPLLNARSRRRPPCRGRLRRACRAHRPRLSSGRASSRASRALRLAV